MVHQHGGALLEALIEGRELHGAHGRAGRGRERSARLSAHRGDVSNRGVLQAVASALRRQDHPRATSPSAPRRAAPGPAPWPPDPPTPLPGPHQRRSAHALIAIDPSPRRPARQLPRSIPPNCNPLNNRPRSIPPPRATRLPSASILAHLALRTL
jgi:hypothetical protein